MGTMLIVYTFLAVLVIICVVPLYSGLKQHVRSLPLWFPFVLVIFILLAFLLVPNDSQAMVQMFRSLH
jgi:hypothetical protein